MIKMNKSYMTTDELLAGFGCFTGLLGSIFGIACLVVLNPTIAWLLWNWVMVEVFAAPVMTWLQMLGVYVLAQILLGKGILTVKWGKE